jgi:hypothetical protein
MTLLEVILLLWLVATSARLAIAFRQIANAKEDAKLRADNANVELEEASEDYDRLTNKLVVARHALDCRNKEIESLRKINEELSIAVNRARIVLSVVYPASEVSGRTIDHTGSDSQDNTGAS